MRRTFAASVLAALLVAAPALGADADTAAKVPALDLTAAALTVTAVTQAPPNFSSTFEARFRRPSSLPALYAASAALQGYDAYSTLSVLKHGGIEANPVMKHVVKNPAVFVALKAGVTATSIVAAEKLWKRGNRLGAIGLMVVSNTVMGVVATNNARVLSSLK